METLEKEIDNVKYVMRPASAMSAWSALKKSAAIFKGISIDTKTGGTEIGAILENLGSQEVEQIEKLIFEHTTVVIDDEKPFKLSSQIDSHFNEHRSHILQVLIAGAMYQFADFFPKELLSKATAMGSQLLK